jgi:uncharacterized membrane protein
MSEKRVFTAALMTAVLIVAGAFTFRQFFAFELAKSSIYIAIAVLVYFGENRYSYMLGIMAPPLWFIVDILGGVFFRDFGVLYNYVSAYGTAPLETPLHALARLSAILLFAASVQAWRREVAGRFISKAFWTSAVVSVIYAAILAGWHAGIVPGGIR